MKKSKKTFPANIREPDKAVQELGKHLLEVGHFAKEIGEKLGFPLMAELCGLAHDWGKYTEEFKTYLENVAGVNGKKEQKKARRQRGKIDHSTAGAILVHDLFRGNLKVEAIFVSQIVCNTVLSHHSKSGIKDFVSFDEKSPFLKRLRKEEKDTRVREATINGNPEILQKIKDIAKSPEILEEAKNLLTKIKESERHAIPRSTYCGHIQRMLFGCLLQADLKSALKFQNSSETNPGEEAPPWSKIKNQIQEAGKDKTLLRKAKSPRGLFLMKHRGEGNLIESAFLFAAAHAKNNEKGQAPLKRIIFVSNDPKKLERARLQAKKMLPEKTVQMQEDCILAPLEERREKTTVVTQEWNRPVILTTTETFLRLLFSNHKAYSRLAPNLANSIIVFEDAQAISPRFTDLFVNSLNFLTKIMGSSLLLLGDDKTRFPAKEPEKGNLNFDEAVTLRKIGKEAHTNRAKTYPVDYRRKEGWTPEESADLAKKKNEKHHKILLILNTEEGARRALDRIQDSEEGEIPKTLYFGNRMSPAHLTQTTQALANDFKNRTSKLICVATLEAMPPGAKGKRGFSSIIQALAGLNDVRLENLEDSKHAEILLINTREVEPNKNKDLAEKQRASGRILNQRNRKGRKQNFPKEIQSYMEAFLHETKEQSSYPLNPSRIIGVPCKTSMLDLLSENNAAKKEWRNPTQGETNQLILAQAFSTAGRYFDSKEGMNIPVITPFKEGHEALTEALIKILTGKPVDFEEQGKILKGTEEHCIFLSKQEAEKLNLTGTIEKIDPDVNVYIASSGNYSLTTGI